MLCWCQMFWETVLYDITCLHRIQLKIQFKWYIVTGLVHRRERARTGQWKNKLHYMVYKGHRSSFGLCQEPISLVITKRIATICPTLTSDRGIITESEWPQPSGDGSMVKKMKSQAIEKDVDWDWGRWLAGVRGRCALSSIKNPPPPIHPVNRCLPPLGSRWFCRGRRWSEPSLMRTKFIPTICRENRGQL